MNHKTILINLLLFVCLLFCGCEKWMSEHFGKTILDFDNNAKYDISVYSMVMPPNQCSSTSKASPREPTSSPWSPPKAATRKN